MDHPSPVVTSKKWPVCTKAKSGTIPQHQSALGLFHSAGTCTRAKTSARCTEPVHPFRLFAMK